jgi:putative ABC transport system permease protein
VLASLLVGVSPIDAAAFAAAIAVSLATALAACAIPARRAAALQPLEGLH